MLPPELDKNNIKCEVMPANIDEDQVKESLQNEKASPELISKNLNRIKPLRKRRHLHLDL